MTVLQQIVTTRKRQLHKGWIELTRILARQRQHFFLISHTSLIVYELEFHRDRTFYEDIFKTYVGKLIDIDQTVLRKLAPSFILQRPHARLIKQKCNTA